MRFNFYLSLLAISVLCVMPTTWADTKDAQSPITIEADRAELDEKKEMSIYQGNVILQQGGTKVIADILHVYAKEGQLQRITAKGNPIQFFHQRKEREDIRGSSLRLEYNTEEKQFILLDKAELWQGKNWFSGERIQFDTENEKVLATGKTDDTGKSPQRVQITIQPKPKKNNNPSSVNKKQ